jgi:hypothetical protein
MRLNPPERRIYVGNVHYRQHPLNELIIKTGGRLPCATCMSANVHSLKVREFTARTEYGATCEVSCGPALGHRG